MKRVMWLAFMALLAASPLPAQEPKLRATLNGRGGPLRCVAFSPNGKSVVGN